MNEHTPEAAAKQINSSVAALMQELARLTQDLCALRARIGAGKAPDPHAMSAQLADVKQWLVIAQEMEQRLDSQSQNPRQRSAPRAELNLDEARLDIGRKLDRLRAARSPDSVS